MIDWILYLALIITGIIMVITVCLKFEKGRRAISLLSIGFGVLAILFLSMSSEPYATTLAFLLILFKGLLIYKKAKTK